MEILMGAAGAVLALGCFGAGAVLGWRIAGKLRMPPAAMPLEEREARRLREGQEAFRSLQNYSAEQAYGMLRKEEVDP